MADAASFYGRDICRLCAALSYMKAREPVGRTRKRKNGKKSVIGIECPVSEIQKFVLQIFFYFNFKKKYDDLILSCEMIN